LAYATPQVQFDAAKGGYDFSYEGLDRNKYQQNNRQKQGQNNKKTVKKETCHSNAKLTNIIRTFAT